MTPAVTVIVPVYNVAPYIEKCARSLFEQTLQNLEIIFVDDCSLDNSVEIIRHTLSDYPSRQPLTRIVKMPVNSGQAAVRRQGILEATGDYIIHCDGDDWVDASLYESLYNLAIEKGADIAVCDEVEEFEGWSRPKRTHELPDSGREVMRNWYKCTVGMFCHNKLVRRSLYLDNDILPWVGLNMWEDNGLFSRLFYHANKIAQFHDGPVYHYNRANVNAMTSGYGMHQVEQMIGNADNLALFFNSKPDAADFEKTVKAFKYLAILNLITDSFKNYKRYLKELPSCREAIKHIPLGAFSSRGKVRFLMVKYKMTPFFIILFKIKNLIRL